MTASLGQYPQGLEDRLAQLEKARNELLREIENCGAQAPHAAAETGRWSIPEIVYHLHLTEKRVLKGLRRNLDSGPRQERMSEEMLRAEWERVRSLVGIRQAKQTAPPSVVPSNVHGLRETVDLLKQSRLELLEALRHLSLDELASISMPHPFPAIGTLTGAGWLSVIAFHEVRHAEQLREIKALPPA